MTKQREPQVGDVGKSGTILAAIYSIEDDTIYYQYILKETGPSGIMRYMEKSDWYMLFEHFGKLAPRYKRLFGIYYIPDNNG